VFVVSRCVVGVFGCEVLAVAVQKCECDFFGAYCFLFERKSSRIEELFGVCGL
jgi:hypothetical protein